MDAVYQPTEWFNLYIMLGTAASALVGLLFIVMVLHLGDPRENRGETMRATIHGARNNTYHLLTLMIMSALVLMPQPAVWLGGEIVVMCLFGLRLPVGFTRTWLGRDMHIEARSGFPYDVIVTVAVGYLLGVGGGIGLMMDRNWGMYAVSAGALVILVRTVLTARELLFGRVRAPDPGAGE